MFDTTTSAAKEYKKQSMVEAIKYAETEVKMDNLLEGTDGIEISDLIAKLQETSNIQGNNYIISVNDVEQIASIIDKKTGVVIDLSISPQGNVVIASNIVNDISNVIQPTIEYSISPQVGEYAEEITITITATEESNGIVKIQFPDDSEKTYDNLETITETYTVTQNGRYKFVVQSANGRTASKYVEITNSMQASDIGMNVENSEPTNGQVNISITYDSNITVGGQVLSNPDRFQYSIGENNWETATANQTVSVDTNGIVYSRYFDGTTGYKTATTTVSNIDKEVPAEFNLTVTQTTNSITVSGSTTDTGSVGCAPGNVGIVGYQFKLMDSAGATITDWTTIQTGTSYIFDQNISQTTEYKVSMRAIDKAGNITEATNKNSSVTTGTVIAAEGNVTITPTPATPTKNDVKIVITTSISGYTLQYKVGDGSWDNYTQGATGFTISTNQTIFARLVDSTNQAGNTTSITVSNIDKVSPTAFNLTATKTTNSITVSGSTTDTGSTGCAAGNIGIVGYQFKLMDNTEATITDWTTIQTGTSYTFDQNIPQTTEYKVSMRAIDKAGNITEATNKNSSVITETVTDSSIKIGIAYNPSTPTNETVNVIFTNNSGVSGLIMKYQIGSTTGNWTNYTGPVPMSTNGVVYARLFDSTNQFTNTATANVVNIDRLAPVTSTIEKSNVAQTTFTLKATGADETSISKYEFYINGVLEETVDTTETTATINVTGKTAGNEYTCKVIVYDGANNLLESSEIEVITLPIIVSNNQTYTGQTVGTYSNPIIPKGFGAVNTNGAIWGSADGYQKGLVIQDAIGNQFVWVPVDGTTVTFARYNFAKGVSLSSCSETMLAQISTSVSTNGGFYIARYEAGIAAGMSKPTADTTTTYGSGTYKPVSKAGVEVWDSIQWGTSNSDDSPGNGAVTVARSMYTGSEYGVTSTLIYGAQWDTALKFIGAYNVGEAGYSTYATNSTGMGNYSSGDEFTSTTKPATCGASGAFRQKNIYDMAGNVWEWTMEAYSSSRVNRGGSYFNSGSDYPAAYRGVNGSASTYSGLGFRVGLYIK